MASHIDDGWLWLGFGAATFFAVKGIQHALGEIVRLTEIDPHQYEPRRKKGDHPEDKLTVEELKVLADSPYPNIANAAVSLILSRFARLPHATQMITKDLASDDKRVKQRAHTAVRFLRYYDGEAIDDRRRLPMSPPGYTTPTHWSEGTRTPSDDYYPRPAIDLRAQWLNDGGIIIPSVEDPVAGWERVPRERDEQFAADGDTRRRRREAMVLHEGGGAITGNDIIRPTEAD